MDMKGFTLIELIVVIVIVGVLALVAIPKMTAAANKAKAFEGQQIISDIANLEHTFNAEYEAFALAPAESSAEPLSKSWGALGMDQNPVSKYFTFSVVAGNGGAGAPTVDTALFPEGVTAWTDFKAVAKLTSNLGTAKAGDSVTIDDQDEKIASTELNKFIGFFGAVSK